MPTSVISFIKTETTNVDHEKFTEGDKDIKKIKTLNEISKKEN